MKRIKKINANDEKRISLQISHSVNSLINKLHEKIEEENDSINEMEIQDLLKLMSNFSKALTDLLKTKEIVAVKDDIVQNNKLFEKITADKELSDVAYSLLYKLNNDNQ